MENNQDLPTGTLDELKSQAEQAVVSKDGQFYLKFDKPVQGVDPQQTYVTHELAVDAAFSALKKNSSSFKVVK
jgi:hypothetical protein